MFAPDVQRTRQFEIEQHGTGIVASLEDKALGAPPKKKRSRAVLFSDSDDDLDQETDEVTSDEIDAYSTTNFDFEDGTTHLWLSGSRIALAYRNWRSSL